MNAELPRLQCQKSRFALDPQKHYLNCAYMSPLALEVEEAGKRGMLRKRRPADITSESFFDESDRVRARFADLIGCADPQRIAIQPAVSYGIAAAARNVSPSRHQNIVVLGEQFPSNYYAWSRICRDSGAQLRVVEAPQTSTGRGQAWNSDLLQAIDDATAVVAMPQAHWSDGTLFDLVAVRKRTARHGSLLIVDATQTAGALPLSVADIEPDALVCAAYKTLFGPYSMALSYYGRAFDDGVPLEETWTARERSHEFARLVEYEESYRPGALRYDVGERSNMILLPMLEAALEMVASWTAEGVQDYCEQLVAEPLTVLADRGFQVEEPAFRGHHLFGLRPPSKVSLERIHEQLTRRHVSISVRGSSLRVSPHVYNDAADLEALSEALVESL